jgi:hypothetical protein
MFNHGRIKGDKPKSTFGKKPHKGSKKNRKGNTKTTGEETEKKYNYGRIKPKYSSKKGTIKQRVDAGYVPLNPNKPVRFGTKQYWQRVTWIQELGDCQICELERVLDHPHHAEQGANKDDRYMLNVCVVCHTHIHAVDGYNGLEKDFDECKTISWSNHLMCEKREKDML